ncbi:MBL fold metallo-hydrolase [Alkalicoccus halolimnae]|uniref:MBL fold metallo-hydrolase n=1 Tax=Alkalicoccus halolimnae TaxID=1667239 RepID=A0A5C7F178_9BACI|nr:MBL fold metallo-hydrolase [Alkalicoccus halolimnae]TXF83314.1 MBL fold metallo-hydrolase [Alkalicoccus halolimnae]
MRVTRITPHVYKISIWIGLPISVWAVKENDGMMLVDAGIGQMGKGILKEIEQLDIGPLKRIVLTHGHPDHVGAIERIRSGRDVPVYAHPLEIPYIEGELPFPDRKKASVLVHPGLTQPLPDSEDGLSKIGGLKPFLTPGHSPGHTVFYHVEDDVLLGGDLFTSTRRGKLKRPIPLFTYNMPLAVASGSVVKYLKPEILSLCHGTDIRQPSLQYDAYAGKWGKM